MSEFSLPPPFLNFNIKEQVEMLYFKDLKLKEEAEGLKRRIKELKKV